VEKFYAIAKVVLSAVGNSKACGLRCKAVVALLSSLITAAAFLPF